MKIAHLLLACSSLVALTACSQKDDTDIKDKFASVIKAAGWQGKDGYYGSSKTIKFRLIEEISPTDIRHPMVYLKSTKYAYDGEIDRSIMDLADWMFRGDKLVPSRSISVKLPYKPTPSCAGLAQYHTALGFEGPFTPAHVAANRMGRTWVPTGKSVEGLSEFVNKTPMYNEIEGYLYSDDKQSMVVECIKDNELSPGKTRCSGYTEIPVTDRTDVAIGSFAGGLSVAPNINLYIKQLKCNREQLPDLFKGGRVTVGPSAWQDGRDIFY